MAKWLVHQVWDLKAESSIPGWHAYVVLLGKTLNCQSASLYPGV